jgi:microcystin-dependent protein
MSGLDKAKNVSSEPVIAPTLQSEDLYAQNVTARNLVVEDSVTFPGGTLYTQTEVTALIALNTPIGLVSQYIGATAPAGYLICDGSSISRTTYSALWDVLRNGTSSSPYGNGDGTSTFNLPNLKGKVPVGVDTTQTEFDARGETGGSKISTAPHNHSVTHNHAAFDATSGGQNADHSHPFDLNIVHSDGTPVTAEILNVGIYYGGGVSRYQDGTAGQYGGQVHGHTTSIDVPSNTVTSDESSASATSGNLQPYITVNYIIKAL